MPIITVTYADGRKVEIDSLAEGNRQVLFGTAEHCHIRLVGTDVLPVHAYLAHASNHYYLYLAPGARVFSKGRELFHDGDAPALGESDLSGFKGVLRDSIHFELGGALIVARHAT